MKHGLAFLLALFSTHILALDSEIEITENPLEYYEAAFARIRQFLPNAEFNKLESTSSFPLGCSAQEWTFYFVDKNLGEVGEVHTAEYDHGNDGGGSICERTYVVKIAEIGDSDWKSRFTSAVPASHMQNNFELLKQEAIRHIGEKFFITEVGLWFNFSDDLFIQFNGFVDGNLKFIRINATTGAIIAKSDL